MSLVDLLSLGDSVVGTGKLAGKHELLHEGEQDRDDDGGLDRLTEDDEEDGDTEQILGHVGQSVPLQS